MSNGPEILDLDKIIPKKRIVKLSGKEIDVSKIPSEVTLELAEKAEMLQSGSSESFPMVFDMMIKICNATNQSEEVTKDWLVKNTSMEQLTVLMEFIMKPIRDRAEKNQKGQTNPEGKNTPSPSDAN
ncbi:hypothetical protein JCM9140_3140 [Halalkalibacter wakoensis JCM 9140]|uniref:Tail assembly chaperone n=1 Tax=Halalkalibacter wakoensis JCM 9140 TaxID=1236970 RepID=W4Q5Q7_9BACI|nr:hypothetical protein [Halalkalibacter wakoensis]GAE27028.1 hypothetical protein JCM9140_3140 [Halalkalibacter wakoensis JCM 9140]